MLATESQEKAKRPGQHRSRSMRRVAKFIRRKFNLVSCVPCCVKINIIRLPQFSFMNFNPARATYTESKRR